MTDALYKELSEQVKEENHEEVLSIVEKILEKKSDDEKAKIVKVVALIQENKYDEALRSIKKNGLESKLGFEMAYVLYRQNKLKEALEVVEKLDSQGARQLKAQINYKLEKFEKSISLYEEFLDGESLDEEVLTNLSASLIQKGDYSSALDTVKRADNNTYELEYNAACASIGLKQLDQAERHLKLAQVICRESLEEEEYTEEEIINESASILTQLAYVSQLRGKADEAKTLYENVIKSKPSDSVALAVAANNSISLKGSESDLFDSAKKIKMATSEKVYAKLTPAQQRGITLNKALLLMLQKKYDECREVISNISSQMNNSDIPPLVMAALYYKEKNMDKAVESLKKFIEQQPVEKTSRVQVTLAQLYLNQGNITEAANMLNSTIHRHEPSIISASISLYQRNNDIESCLKVFDDSVNYWKTKLDGGQDGAKEKLVFLLNKAAEFKMTHDKYAEAVETYEQLSKVDPGNPEHIAGLVNALSRFDISKAEQYSEQLPSIDISDINAENLESETVLAFKAKKSTVAESLNEQETKTTEKKKKRKRKNKKPKNLDPNKKIDPERWLPKKQRSSYKKKTQTMRGASQGSTSTTAQEKLQHKKGDKTAPATKNIPKPRGPKGSRNKRKR